MGLMDSLRKAEQQGKGAARRGMERARESFDDTQRALRRKMRIYPKPAEPSSAAQPAPTVAAQGGATETSTVKKPAA